MAQAIQDISLVSATIRPLICSLARNATELKISIKFYAVWPLKNTSPMEHTIAELTVIFARVIHLDSCMTMVSFVVRMKVTFIADNNNLSQQGFYLIDKHSSGRTTKAVFDQAFKQTANLDCCHPEIKRSTIIVRTVGWILPHVCEYRYLFPYGSIHKCDMQPDLRKEAM